jgi:hypothetical protein
MAKKPGPKEIMMASTNDPKLEVVGSNDMIPLRQYVDMRFDTQEKAMAAALSASDKAVMAALAAADRAVAKSETASEKRFESVNEFRGALADSARLLMPRLEVEQIIKSVVDRVEANNAKIDAVTSRINSRDDRGRGMGEIWGYVIGALGLCAAVASFILHR